MSTMRAILSTMVDTQYRGGYHVYHWGVQYCGEKLFYYLSTPKVLNTPTVLMLPPQVSWSPSRYSNYERWYPHGTERPSDNP